MVTTVQRFPDLPKVESRCDPLTEPVYWLGTQWAITAYGLEARDGAYFIEHPRYLDDPHLEKHIGRKQWADVEDLAAAYAFAREFFSGPGYTAKAPEPAVVSIAALDAWMAYCPKADPYADHPFAGSIIVGSRETVDMLTDPKLIGSIALPMRRQVCAAGAVPLRPSASPVLTKLNATIQLFEAYAEMTAHVGLDPHAVHKAFLGVTEYRDRLGSVPPQL